MRVFRLLRKTFHEDISSAGKKQPQGVCGLYMKLKEEWASQFGIEGVEGTSRHVDSIVWTFCTAVCCVQVCRVERLRVQEVEGSRGWGYLKSHPRWAPPASPRRRSRSPAPFRGYGLGFCSGLRVQCTPGVSNRTIWFQSEGGWEAPCGPPSPEASGLDCLACAIFARQQNHQ